MPEGTAFLLLKTSIAPSGMAFLAQTFMGTGKETFYRS